jgi:transposase
MREGIILNLKKIIKNYKTITKGIILRAVIHSPDPEYLSKKTGIEKLIKNRPEGAIILYVDEHDVHLCPFIRRCWQDKGIQMKVYTPGENQKLYIFGAYCPYEEAIIAWKIFDRKRSEEFFKFLRYLTKLYPDRRIILILDNFGTHRSKKLSKLLRKRHDVSSKIEFVFLPTYAPELNPIERWWGIIKARAESNYLFKDKKELRKALNLTLRSLLNQQTNNKLAKKLEVDIAA